MPPERPRFLVGRATLALRQGQAGEALRRAAEARAYAEARQMRHLYPLLALTDGEVASAQGQAPDALAAYERAEALAHEMTMRPQAWQAQAAAARMLMQEGRHDEAAAKRQGAQRVIEDIAGGITDAPRRARYLEHALAQL